MLISAIVAMSENRVIGFENRLPWHLPADLQYFKQVTQGKPILMGRKTHESIGRPLPNRENIILTRDKTFHAPGCTIVHSIESALANLPNQSELIVIGGAELYRQTLPLIQRLYLTIIHQAFAGDAFFPEIDKAEWKEIKREDYLRDEKNAYDYSFLVLER